MLSSDEAAGLPWQAVYAFLRIVTNRKLPGVRRTVEEAARIVDRWLAQSKVRLISRDEARWSFPRDDNYGCQLSALTIEYGGVLDTTDRDLARFTGLRWKNPLVGDH